MLKRYFGGALLGGFIGAAAMTVTYLVADMDGVGHMWIAQMLGTLLWGGRIPALGSAMWAWGMLWHFVNGTIVFALIYAFFLNRILPGGPWVRGMLWGVILWLGFEFLFRPIVGLGLFGANEGVSMVVTAITPLVAHLIYGGILGGMTGDPVPLFATHHQSRHSRPWNGGAHPQPH